MEMSLFMNDNSNMNLRRYSSFAMPNNNIGNTNMFPPSGFPFKSPQYNHHHPFVSSPFFDANSSFGGGPFPAANHTAPRYSSLPVHCQPPLLPLPMKSSTLPSSTKKIAVKQNNSKRKKKSQQKPTAEKATKVESPKAIERRVLKREEDQQEEEDTGEEFLIGSRPSSSSVYSLSPPPSSLPLPKMLLMKPRLAKYIAGGGSCIVEAKMGVGADVGATDDLRKLLRI